MTPDIRPILILGPTAGGKSEFAVALAEAISSAGAVGGVEIISADSMQVYRQMDAGTAKPGAALRRRVAHHLIDIVEPTQRFTVADWLKRSEELVEPMRRRRIQPVIVGGTNLYVQAFLEGLFEGPAGDSALRAGLEKLGNEELHERLARADAPAAERIHVNDRKKMVRALEVHQLTGRPISEWQQQWRTGPHPDKGDAIGYRHNPILIGLDWPPQAVNRRINLRVKAMFFPDEVPAELRGAVCPRGESLVDETRRLEAAGLLGAQAREALGYKQVLAYLAGELSLDDAFERTKILTRRYAKTQRTWLKRFRGVHWLAAKGQAASELALQALDVLRQEGPAAGRH